MRTPAEAIGEFCGLCGALVGACVNHRRPLAVSDHRVSFRLAAYRAGNKTRRVTSAYVRENMTGCNCPAHPRVPASREVAPHE